MNLEAYFKGLERKYGNTLALSKFKEDYFEYMKDLPFDHQKHLLRSIKTRLKVEHEINLIKAENKDIFSKYAESLEEGDTSINATQVKPILEELADTIMSFKKGLEKLKLNGKKP